MELCRIKKFDSGPCSDDVVFVGYEAPTRRRCQSGSRGVSGQERYLIRDCIFHLPRSNHKRHTTRLSSQSIQQRRTDVNHRSFRRSLQASIWCCFGWHSSFLQGYVLRVPCLLVKLSRCRWPPGIMLLVLPAIVLQLCQAVIVVLCSA